MAYLAIEGKPCERQVLSTLFWPESSQKSASVSLRVALSKLRKSFGEYLKINRDLVEIKSEADVRVDLQEMLEKLSNGQIESALEIYEGDFLAGFQIQDSPEFEYWQIQKQAQIRDDLWRSLDLAIKTAIAKEDFEFGLKLVKQLLELNPLDETAHQHCMLLYALKGDRSAALEQYKKCAALLRYELDIEPSKDTKKLHETILQGREPSDGITESHLFNFPIQQTSFIGRYLEIYQTSQLLRKPDCRLVTLVGPGGCGKTRLGIKIAELFSDAFQDGIFFVPCEACPDVDFLIPAIANALNFNIDMVASQLTPEIQLIDYLHRRKPLFVLDGFDALAPQAGRLSNLLEKVPGLKLLVTSRQPLNLKSEWIYEVKGLPVSLETKPTFLSKIDAVQLFVDRAKQSNARFYPYQSTYNCIARICQFLEGMPLAIELAATWTSILPIDDIEIEVSKNLDFLQTNQRDIPEKHHSIRAVFNGSWKLLSSDQRNNLCKLSVFQGSFDREAVNAVVGFDIAQLVSLVDQSLVSSDQEGRFSMHQLVKQFAYEKLTQDTALHTDVHNRFYEYYTNFLIQRETDLMGNRMLAAREEIRQELPHVYSAVRWASLNWDLGSVQKILASFEVFFAVHGWHDGIDAFKNIVDLRRAVLDDEMNSDSSADPVILICRVHQAFLLSNLGQIDESEAISSECLVPLRKFGLAAEVSECLHNLGVNASFRGEYEKAQLLLEEAILLGRESNHILWPTYLLWLGHVYFLLGEYEQGLITLKKCRDIFMEKGTLWGAAFALSKMGLAADGLEQHEQALGYHQEALAVFEEIENKAGMGYSISRMSMSACFLHRYEQALELGKKALEIFEEIGHRWGISSCISRIGFAHIGMEAKNSAREAFIEALRLSKQHHMAPLSLYALAGLACTMVHEGQEQSGLALLNYVMQHPKTPKAYLDQAFCLLEKTDRMGLQYASSLGSEEKERQPLEEVVDRYLYAVENFNL